MNTDALIRQLAAEARPVSRHAVGRRLALGIVIGGAITFGLIWFWLGIRPDLGPAMRGFPFWLKWGYTISLGICAMILVAALARPDTVRLRWLWLVVVPFASLAGMVIKEMAQAPSAEWLAMWLGHSWTHCPWFVLALAAPIFIGLLWSFRQFAPTRLRAAGAAAGLAAGACSATLYGLNCAEVSALFVLTWYTLGILLSAAVGALVGPRLLRW